MPSSIPTVTVMTKLTYGADVELFVQTREGVIMPADTVMCTLTDVPSPTKYSLQIDGACLEYHLPICKSITEFIDETRNSIHSAHYHVKVHGCTAIAVPSATIREDLLDRSRYGHEFGCKPDYNAYAPQHGRRLKACDYGYKRTAGGHLHIGVPDDTKLRPYNLVKVLDVLISVNYYGDGRHQLFPFGTFRPTAYGIEYRTLSNCWADGYSRDFRILIEALHTLEDKWDRLQELDDQLTACADMHETSLLLFLKGI
jgi:hypothetical protein